MNKPLPILLWILVFISGGITFFFLKYKNNDYTKTDFQPERAFQQIPWKHLQDIPPFQLTDQEGNEFDSASLVGRPYVVSFFFAECPTICAKLNKHMQQLRERMDDPELVFLSITVDPDRDTPEILKAYAANYNANVDDWKFLTGDLHRVQEVGERSFQVIVDREIHTEDIMLVDRWGRFRDRFKWDDAYDSKRFLSVAKDVLAEQKPPLNSSFETRNMMAGAIPSDLSSIKWIRDFHLTNQDEGEFFSRNLTGEVWIANFFFTSCPDICIKQNEYLAGLQKRLKDHPARIVSITTDPNQDTPGALQNFANQIGANLDSWTFLTGNQTLINRVSAEFFGASSSENHHSTRLFVVDRWGQVRGNFDWRQPEDEVQMLKLIDELNEETQPGSTK